MDEAFMPDRALSEPQTTTDMAAPAAAEGLVSSQTVTTSTGPARMSWLSRNLRNAVVIALTGMVCYLAYVGEEQARMALITSFTLLAGSLFGERAALKTPGKDQ